MADPDERTPAERIDATRQAAWSLIRRLLSTVVTYTPRANLTAVRQDHESGDNWAAHRSGPKTS